jgi:hypothetical protein
VSLVCCFCMEREKACPGTAPVWGERERLKWLNREGLSTDPGWAGGLVRSSGEAPAGRGGGGAKGPGRLGFVRRSTGIPGGAGWAS